MVKRPSPMMMGVMGFRWRSGLASDVEAEQAEFFFPEAGVGPELLHPLWFGSRTSKAAMQVAATDGGCEVENRNGARVAEKIDQIASATDVSTESAIAFDKVPT